MNQTDAFLRDLRERPRPEFAEALYQKINRPRGLQGTWRWAMVAVAVVLVTALTMMVSPTVRAGALSLIRRIGSVEVEETDLYPGMGESVYSVQAEKMTLAAAREALPFDLALPTWVPQGLEMGEDVVIIFASATRPVTTVSVTWGTEAEAIRFTVEQRADGQPMRRVVAGEESAEDVAVNGQPAALIRGTWNAADGTYDRRSGLMLMWAQDGISYSLRTWNEAVSAEELIQMAGSVP